MYLNLIQGMGIFCLYFLEETIYDGNTKLLCVCVFFLN